MNGVWELNGDSNVEEWADFTLRWVGREWSRYDRLVAEIGGYAKWKGLLINYGRNVCSTARTGDKSEAWVRYARTGELCDEHLMGSALSALRFKEGDVCLPLCTGEWIVDYAVTA